MSSSGDPVIRKFHCLFIVLKISLFSMSSSHDPVSESYTVFSLFWKSHCSPCHSDTIQWSECPLPFHCFKNPTVLHHRSIQYDICELWINQSHYLDHFPICWETNGVSKESTCVDNMKSHYQTHVTEVVKDMCDNWMVSFCKVFGLQGWVFNGWVSKIFAMKNISLRSQPPTINNDRSLMRFIAVCLHRVP
jgi:hypothetical protein